MSMLWYWGAKIVITIVEFQYFMVQCARIVCVKFLIEYGIKSNDCDEDEWAGRFVMVFIWSVSFLIKLIYRQFLPPIKYPYKSFGDFNDLCFSLEFESIFRDYIIVLVHGIIDLHCKSEHKQKKKTVWEWVQDR